MDVLQGDGAFLGAGDRFLGDEKDVAILQDRGAILVRNLNNVVRIGDDMGFDAEPAVIHTVHCDDFVLLRIYHISGRRFRLPAAWFASLTSFAI